MLDKFGLRRGDDVFVVSLGSQNERLGGLQAGAVAAAMLQAPFTASARKVGYHVLFDYAEDDSRCPAVASSPVEHSCAISQTPCNDSWPAIVDAIHCFKTDREGTKAVIGVL